jgi:hypothetical protein
VVRLACALAVTAAVASVGLCSAARAAPVSASKYLQTILAAASRQKSVHYVATTTNSVSSIKEVGDAGLRAGIQQITYHAHGKTGHVTIVVSGGREYIRGDVFGLAGYLGLHPRPAARFANRWVSLRASDQDYARFASAVMLPTTKSVVGLVAELVLVAPLSTAAPTTIDGVHVRGVRGQLLVAGANRFITTLYAGSSNLPVAEIGRQGSAYGTVHLSKWNEPLHVDPPAHPTPIASTGLE